MWDELGIAPCDDPKAIRRAYAARLKKLDPDRNPEGFARLRRAFEWALSGGGGKPDLPSSQPPQGTDRDAEPEQDDSRPASCANPKPDRSEPASEDASAPPKKNVQEPGFRPPAPSPDHDEIRDRALLIALEAALRRRDANEAAVLYYRAAATGALSLASAPDMLERVLAVAVDDRTLGPAAYRGLVRAAGLDRPRSRAQATSELHRRALARLQAEDWYDDLLATAQRRKGRVARRRSKIARLLLGRIGRHWHPRVDKTALSTWLAQYRTHEAWLGERIDQAWIGKLEGRLRRRNIFWSIVSILFLGGLLFQLVFLSILAVIDGPESLWPLVIAPLAIVFLLWLLKLLLTQLLTLTFPRWTGIAGRGRAIWNRFKPKKPGDAG